MYFTSYGEETWQNVFGIRDGHGEVGMAEQVEWWRTWKLSICFIMFWSLNDCYYYVLLVEQYVLLLLLLLKLFVLFCVVCDVFENLCACIFTYIYVYIYC